MDIFVHPKNNPAANANHGFKRLPSTQYAAKAIQVSHQPSGLSQSSAANAPAEAAHVRLNTETKNLLEFFRRSISKVQAQMGNTWTVGMLVDSLAIVKGGAIRFHAIQFAFGTRPQCKVR
jgi:hypothetical protein